MAALFPFRALRPRPDVAARVAAVPYDVVSVDEARAQAGDPLSFLHVSRAEIDLPHGTDPHSDEVYSRAAANFEALVATAPLVREDAESLYVYRLATAVHTQTGIAGCFSIDDYDRGVIRKHEHTRPDKETDRTRHMLALRAQTGPVFLIHRASGDIQTVAARTTREAGPLLDVQAPDGVRHTIWRVPEAGAAALVTAFAELPALYIADGHHRAASASRARRELGGTAGVQGTSDHVLAVAFPDNQTRILPYNRAVRDLGPFTVDSFLSRLRERLGVVPGPPVPERRGDVAMFVGGTWYRLTLGDVPPDQPAIDRLDVSRLQALVLAPLLGIGDVRTDPRIDFIGGVRGPEALAAAVTSGCAAVAFSMYPVEVADLMSISDQGGIMPPKSTWFEPKLRDGLLSHVIC